jgi:hypothetical protein
MAKKKASKKPTPKKISKKAPPKKKKGGRSPSGKSKASKVRKIIKWLLRRK